VRWQEHIRALVAAGSSYMDAGFGARLEIESIRPWNRQGSEALTEQLLRSLLALRCEAVVRRHGADEGKRGPCERALTAFPDMPRALFWAGLARANSGNRSLAVTRLRRAMTLDPAFDGPWKVLADIYRFEGRKAELETLRSEHQARFGKPLR
jgi:hypothetical protein